ncbi:MAG: hypothetical protein ACYTGL_13925 [Planctomycetota bacterium]|jgi:hypothetical protein
MTRRPTLSTDKVSLSLSNWIGLTGLVLAIVAPGIMAWSDVRTTLATQATQIEYLQRQIDDMNKRLP